jgi:putative inorganic carbon (hco3(-)) transporter
MLTAATALYLAILFLRPHEYIPALAGIPIVDISGLLCLICVLGSRKDWKLPQYPLAFWFVILSLLSVGIAGWWGGISRWLPYLVSVLGTCFVVAIATRERRRLEIIMAVLIVCAAVMVLHGHLQRANGIGWTGTPLILGRIAYLGMFSDPNDLGLFFVMAVGLSIYFLRRSSAVIKLIVIAGIGWLTYGAILTDSRGTLIALMAVFGLEAARRAGKTTAAVFGAISCLTLVATTRLATVSGAEESAAGRVEAWYAGMQMFFSHPLIGVGLGNFTEHHEITAHNSIVLPLAELGLLGFLPWLAIFWYTARMLHWMAFAEHSEASPGHTPATEVNAEVVAAQSILYAAVGVAISSFFLSQSYKHVAFLIVGLTMARFARFAEMFADVPRYKIVRDTPKLIALAFAAILGMWLVVRFLV